MCARRREGCRSWGASRRHRNPNTPCFLGRFCKVGGGRRRMLGFYAKKTFRTNHFGHDFWFIAVEIVFHTKGRSWCQRPRQKESSSQLSHFAMFLFIVRREKDLAQSLTESILVQSFVWDLKLLLSNEAQGNKAQPAFKTPSHRRWPCCHM